MAFSNPNSNDAFIRLDVLYEDNPYTHTIAVPIDLPFLKQEGTPLMVNVPTKEDILGDKITAFGPNSIGIPYFKGVRDCSLDNRVGGKRSSFLPTFVFRPLTPPYMRFRIRRFFILRTV